MSAPADRPVRRPTFRLLAPLLLLLSAGCGATRVDDQRAIADAERLHGLLQPALLDARSPKLGKYLREFGARLLAGAKAYHAETASADAGDEWLLGGAVQFHALDLDLPTATTGGGQHVYVSSGLVGQCESEDELAAALCHAYAHAYLRHVQKRAPREATGGAEVELIRRFVFLQFGPEEERAADEAGLAIYARAGWAPERFATLAARLATSVSREVLPDPRPLAARAAALARAADSLPPASADWRQAPVADARRFAQNQAECRAAARPANDQPPAAQRAGLVATALWDCVLQADLPMQDRARQLLLPPPPPPTDSENPWGKGVPRPRREK